MTVATTPAEAAQQRAAVPVADDVVMDEPGAVAANPEEAIRRALDVPTRAGIFRRLQTEGAPLSAREIADRFGLHPNVARNHLDALAEAGLAITGRRKHPA